MHSVSVPESYAFKYLLGVDSVAARRVVDDIHEHSIMCAESLMNPDG